MNADIIQRHIKLLCSIGASPKTIIIRRLQLKLGFDISSMQKLVGSIDPYSHITSYDLYLY